MAVIKQRRTTFASGIGVVRADTGAAEMWRGVGKLADTMIEGSFNQLKEQARQQGVDTAQAAEIGSLRTIDPETGQPTLMKSLSSPEGFGSIAQNAYSQVIERRYVDQIEQDFKIKAGELALKYKYDENSVAKFSDEMADFIEQSTKNSAPKFQSTVKQIGSGLLASNKLNLMEAEMIRQRNNTVTDFGLSHADSITSLQTMFSSNDIVMQSDARILQSQRLSRIDEMRKAELLTDAEAATLRTEVFNARAAGTVSRISQIVSANENMDSLTLNNVRDVIQNNGIGLDTLPKEIQEVVSEIINMEVVTEFQGDDPVDSVKVFSQIKKFAGTALGESQSRLIKQEAEAAASETREQKEAKEQAVIDRREAVFGILGKREAVTKDISRLITASDANGAVARFREYEKDLRSLSDPARGDSAIPVETVERSITLVRRTLNNGMMVAVGSNLSTNDFAEFERYILSEGRSGTLSKETKLVADTILSTSDFSADRDDLSRDLTFILNDKVATDRANAGTKAEVQAISRVTTGQGSSKNNQDALVLEKVVTNNDNSFWLKADSFETRNEWGQKIINTNVLPTGLQNTLKSFVNGARFSAQQQQNFIQYYDMFSRVPSKDGSAGVINMWDGVLTASEQGLLRATLNIASVEGSVDVPTIMDNLRTGRADTESFNRKTTAMFKDDGGFTAFIDKISTDSSLFVADVPNPNVSAELKDYAEYLIAGHANRDEIKEQLTNYYEQHYKDNGGMVIDYTYGNVNKSRQSLQVAFPSAEDRQTVVNFLNDQLVNQFGVTDKFFKEDKTSVLKAIENLATAQGKALSRSLDEIKIDTNRLVLMPLQGAGAATAGSNDSRYMVMQKLPDGRVEPFMPSYSEPDVEGDGENLMPTMVVFSIGQFKDAVAKTRDPNKGKATQADIDLKERQRRLGSTITEDVPLFGTTIPKELFQ